MENKLYMTDAQALAEANRCLHCYEAPCQSACPAGVDVPRFIHRIATGDWTGAAETIREGNPLGLVCGLVCPSAELCRRDCNCGKLGESIRISDLQAYAMRRAVARGAAAPEAVPQQSGRVAVIGGGPSGVVAAALLRAKGYGVTLFEKADHLGGVPMDEIPNDRLDKALFQKEIEQLLGGGVEVRLGAAIDADGAAAINAGYDAVYLACGLGEPNAGLRTDARGCMSAEAFLRAANGGGCTAVSGTAIVQGGGNTAIDAAVTAKKLGAERVLLCYRRSQREMPAWEDEFLAAVRAGVEFLFQTQVLDVQQHDGAVSGVVLAPVALGEPDASGRRRPIAKPGSEFTLPVDTVIVAIGNSPNPLIPQTTPALATQKWGGIVVEEGSLKTSVPRVYAGGDAVTGAATVILAMGAGKEGAEEIDKLLSEA